MGFKEWIIPQDRVFFDLLEKHIWSNVEAWRVKIGQTEHEADLVGHEVFDRLNRTFITPIDREDIARLTHALDDIVDAIYAATTRIAIVQVPAATTPMKQLIAILEAQIRELSSSVRALRKPATLKREIPGHAVEIHRLENQADQVLRDAISDLFRSNDPLVILKYKEIYEFLEWATDCCEDAADVLQDILRKHG